MTGESFLKYIGLLGLWALIAVVAVGQLYPEWFQTPTGRAVIGEPRSVECRSMAGVVKLDSSMRFAGCLLPPPTTDIAASKVGP